jgi:hypothetical protein
MRRLFVFTALLCIVGADHAAAQSDAAKAMVGAWEISNADRDKHCNLNFKTDPVKGGFKIEFEKPCLEIFPALRELESWAIVNDFLRLLDARGRIVFEFTEVESGMFEAERIGEGLYFLQSLAAASPAVQTPEQMTGEWNIIRGGKPICAVNLTPTGAAGLEGFTLRILQPCDPLVMRFNPSAWRMDRGELVFASANGQIWRFEESDPVTWRRLPEGADPVTLVRR